jgi:predicted transcriptional regulator
MSSNLNLQNEQLFSKIKVISNRLRFRILELTQKEKVSISKLSSILKLSYTKCADYVSILEKQELIKKKKDGKEVFVTSKIIFEKDKILF